MAPNQKPARRRFRAEMFLMLAGLAVVWFALVGAAAYIVGPARLCYYTMPADLCEAVMGPSHVAAAQ